MSGEVLPEAVRGTRGMLREKTVADMESTLTVTLMT